MKRKNDFEWIKQEFYEDGGDIHWWIDEDEIEEFLLSWGDDVPNGTMLKKTDERTIRGKEYNEWMIGNVFGDYEGDFVDEDCPECEHLLVKPNRHEDYFTGNELHCSNHDCKWHNEAMKTFWDKNEAEWAEMRDPNKPEEIKIRIAGETIFEFAKRVGLELDGKGNFYIKDDNYWTDCMVCKRSIPADDFYIGQGTGFAMITFSHDDCTNGGPCIGTPFKKETKEEWGKLI